MTSPSPHDNFDVKLTAYVLGELSPADARAVADRLNADEAARAELADIRATTDRIAAALANETAPGLTAQQRLRIQQRPIHAPRSFAFRRRVVWLGSSLAAAACLGLAVMVWWMADERGGEVAIDIATPAAETGINQEREYRLALDESAEDTRRKTMDGVVASDGAVTSSALAKDAPAPARIGTAGAGRTLRDPMAPPAAQPSGAANAAPAPIQISALHARRVVQSEANGSGVARQEEADERAPATRSGGGGGRRLNVDAAQAPRTATTIDLGTREDNPAVMPGVAMQRQLRENPPIQVKAEPISRLWIERAATSINEIQRFIKAGQFPPVDAVRIEEMINHFTVKPPQRDQSASPVRTRIEVMPLPWRDPANADQRQLAWINFSADSSGAATAAVAQQVQIQLDFNPDAVESYRLIGFDQLEQPTAGSQVSAQVNSITPGWQMNALYEFTAAPQNGSAGKAIAADTAPFAVEIQYQRSSDGPVESARIAATQPSVAWEATSQDFKFIASVAAFGLVLRDSPYRGSASYARVLDMLQQSISVDDPLDRLDFTILVEQAKLLHERTRN